MVAQQNKGDAMDINKVGVIGAGQMGNGIAHVFALAGYDVVMNDISQEALNSARYRLSTRTSNGRFRVRRSLRITRRRRLVVSRPH